MKATSAKYRGKSMAGSGVKGDRRALQQTMDAILAQRSRPAAQTQLPGLENQTLAHGTPGRLPERIAELVHDLPTQRRLSDLVLTDSLISEVQEFLHEYSEAPLLRSHSLEPRHTVLLVGPPGNGKTSLAEALATELGLPLLSIRYDAIVDSYLGETSNRLRRIMDFAALNPCVLFFDEFDAVGKERSDAQETGEIKRVVSTLLVQMDRLPSHVVVVCATNHPELLDRAVWRRFELKLEVGQPNNEQLVKWFERFEKTLATSAGITAAQFAEYMAGENMSAVEAFTLDVRRKIVLSKGKTSAAQAVKQVLERMRKRANALTQGESDANGLSDRPPRSRGKGTGKNPRAKGQAATEGLFPSAATPVAGKEA